MDESVFTVKEVAARVRLNPETIRRWIKDGRIKGISMGSDRGGYRIPESELRRLLAPPGAAGEGEG